MAVYRSISMKERPNMEMEVRLFLQQIITWNYTNDNQMASGYLDAAAQQAQKLLDKYAQPVVEQYLDDEDKITYGRNNIRGMTYG